MHADGLRWAHTFIGAFSAHTRATEPRRSRPRSARFVQFPGKARGRPKLSR